MIKFWAENDPVLLNSFNTPLHEKYTLFADERNTKYYARTQQIYVMRKNTIRRN